MSLSTRQQKVTWGRELVELQSDDELCSESDESDQNESECE